jgi:hypothetical protein
MLSHASCRVAYRIERILDDGGMGGVARAVAMAAGPGKEDADA